MLRMILAALLALLLSGRASAQFDADAISSAIQAGEYGSIKSLLIQRGDDRLYERYFRGAHAGQLHLLNSVTKSVGATLIGVAVRRNLVSLDAPIASYFPDYPWQSTALAANRDLRLREILSMRAGLAWDEWSTSFVDPRNSFVQMTQSADWYRHVLSLPRAAPPDSAFNYNTGSSILMSGVLREVSGKSPQQLLAEELFAPLQIEQWRFELWGGISQFPYNDAPLGAGLWLRPADLLKFGRMLLDGGQVGERTLVDASWIRQMFSRYSHPGNEPFFVNERESYGYGYQWWYAGVVDSAGREHPMWYADGAGRQFLMLFPQLDLIVVSTADDYSYRGPGVFTLLREQILPSMRQSITPQLAGSYYGIQTPGEGLNVEVLSERGEVLAYWYTQHNGAQRFFVLQGAIVGDRAELQIHTTVGGHFQDPANRPALQPAGSAVLYWNSCSEAVLEYSMELGSGSYALSRLSGACVDPAPLG